MERLTILLLFVAAAFASVEENRDLEDDDLFEGDIRLTEDQRIALDSRAAIKTRKWPDGVVVYDLESSISSQSGAVKVINDAIAEYRQKTCVRFRRRTANDQAYISIFRGSGCWSYVGRTGGKQQLSLSTGCWYKGIVIHEFAHALGFYHEQSRPDRDNYVTIMFQNIQSGKEGNFIKNSLSSVTTHGTTYDYDSVMHYSGRAFSKNGQPTIVSKKPGITLGQRRGLSRLDEQQVRSHYSCSGCNVNTTNGRCCVFPFTYNNKPYLGCTKQSHNRLWCATTSNYDRDRQWGDCIGCDVKTTNGRCCVFPFTYNNKPYSGCTKQDYNRLWCATTSNYGNDQLWGDCVGCDVKTTNGRCCVFPFTYNNKSYSGCTNQDHNRLWCATTSNYDNDQQWGDCVGPNPATPPPPQTPASPQGACGIRPHTRIVGGTAATQGSWPWQAQLRTTSGFPYCGGSLIAPQWILTATHCVRGKSANSIVIRLGAHRRTASVGTEQDIRVSRVITHSSYHKPTSYAHDIALLKLGTPARLNKNVNLVCLPDNDPAPADGKKCWITGWGRLSSGGATPDLLQQVVVPIASRARCDRAYPNKIHDSMICAGLDKGGIDSCQGDSGGPMVCENGGRYYIHGATSWGYGCASPGKFGVYAKVKYLLNWVKTEMAKN